MGNAIDLTYKNKMGWIKALILGFLIGLAVILPGISGATLAIIFGLYTKMIYSFGNIFKDFKKCFMFLLPIGIGICFGFALGFLFVQKVFMAQPFILICLFTGLMIGAFPAVTDEIKGVKFDKKKILLITLGVIIPICVGIVSIFIQDGSSDPIIASPLLMFLYFIMGVIVSVTQIIPGLSCSALLMAFGQFGAILASVHVSYLLDNPLVILTLMLLAIGFGVGIISFSKLLNTFVDKKRDDTFTLIVGLSMGSIVTMFLNPDIYNVYTGWNSFEGVLFDIGIGSLLLIIGVIASYYLVKYQRNANKNK